MATRTTSIHYYKFHLYGLYLISVRFSFIHAFIHSFDYDTFNVKLYFFYSQCFRLDCADIKTILLSLCCFRLDFILSCVYNGNNNNNSINKTKLNELCIVSPFRDVRISFEPLLLLARFWYSTYACCPCTNGQNFEMSFWWHNDVHPDLCPDEKIKNGATHGKM